MYLTDERKVGDYTVYRDGTVIGARGWKLTPQPMGKGYLCVEMRGIKRYLYRVVAEAFLDNPLNLPQVNHKNGDKTDNRADNLEWVDNKGNAIHAVQLGLTPSGERHHNSVLSNEDVKKIREEHRSNYRGWATDAAKRYGVSKQHISRIVNKKGRSRG